MAFLVDTNIFVDAYRRYYGFDIVPSFWNFLENQFSAGALVSIKPVFDELKAGDDALADWARNRPSFFKDMDDLTVQKLVDIATWVNQQVAQGKLTQAAASEFLGVADYFLVAFAAAHGLVVVTHEQPSPGAKKRVLIPNVCEAFEVSYTDTFTMMRTLGARI